MTDIAGGVIVSAVEGTTLTTAESDFFRRVHPAGVTLFARNVPPAHDGLKALTASLQALRPAGAPKLVIAIDQEGGRVRRLKAPFPDPGPAMAMVGGKEDLESLQQLRSLAREMGGRLASLGVNVDFAPCVDVLTAETNTAIGDRAFGRAAPAVAKRAGAFLSGLEDAGILGCLKHFPGQGDAQVDTHVGRAVVNVSEATLRTRELAPFAALVDRVPMVMIAHCVYPSLAPEEASRSPRIMTGLLRHEMGFRGVIVSDDMLMGALPQDVKDWQEAIVQAVAGGADMVLVCRHLDRSIYAHEALTREAARHPAFRKRLADAATRVSAMRRSLV